MLVSVEKTVEHVEKFLNCVWKLVIEGLELVPFYSTKIQEISVLDKGFCN